MHYVPDVEHCFDWRAVIPHGLQELESQLMAAAEEKTKVQSKYHELSIKHRQLIETSPQVMLCWTLSLPLLRPAPPQQP
jgi:hypothetical protein